MTLCVELVNDVANCLLDAAFFKRDIQLGQPEQIEIALAAARFAERQVGFPGGLVILLHAPVELEGTDLRKRVVHIIEWIEENMLLLHPESAFFEEGDTVVIAPR